MLDFFIKIIKELIPTLVSPFVVGFAIWFIGNNAEKKRLKVDAIRDLMAYRGDTASEDFRRSLNKVSVTFHNDDEVRLEVRNLYEVINNSAPDSEKLKRSIVGLIYRLCQKNGFKGLTEYDIDQAFPENKQEPQSNTQNTALVSEIKRDDKITESKVNEEKAN